MFPASYIRRNHEVIKNRPAYPLSFGIIPFGKFYFFLRLTMFFSVAEYLSRMIG